MWGSLLDALDQMSLSQSTYMILSDFSSEAFTPKPGLLDLPLPIYLSRGVSLQPQFVSGMHTSCKVTPHHLTSLTVANLYTNTSLQHYAILADGQ